MHKVKNSQSFFVFNIVHIVFHLNEIQNQEFHQLKLKLEIVC